MEATVVSKTDNQMIVTVEKVEAGVQAPLIYITGMGFIPFPPSFPKIYIAANIVSHTEEVFQTGGQTIEITAWNVPANLAKVKVLIGTE